MDNVYFYLLLIYKEIFIWINTRRRKNGELKFEILHEKVIRMYNYDNNVYIIMDNVTKLWILVYIVYSLVYYYIFFCNYTKAF